METIRELNQKIWYRALKVFFVVFVALNMLFFSWAVWDSSTKNTYIPKEKTELSDFRTQGPVYSVIKEPNRSLAANIGYVALVIVIVLLTAATIRKVFHYIVLGKTSESDSNGHL